MADDNPFSMPLGGLPNAAQPGGAAYGYGDPRAIQAAYLRMLQEKSHQQQKGPILSWTQVAAGIADTLADQVQMNRMMQGATQAGQANAALALPGAGGGDSGGAAPSMLSTPPPAPSASNPGGAAAPPPSMSAAHDALGLPPTGAGPATGGVSSTYGPNLAGLPPGNQPSILAHPPGGQASPPGEPPELTGAAPANAPSNDLVGFVKAHEGYKPYAYPDGKQTSIGFGTRATSPNERIDMPEANRRLNTELTKAAGQVEAFAPNAPPGVKNALTDLTYNTGTKWQSAGLGKAVQAGDWGTAQTLFKQYTHYGNGQVVPGLPERRAQAAAWFPGGAESAPGAGPALAFSGGSAPTGTSAPGAPATSVAGPGAAPPGSPAASAGTDPFGPQRGTFVPVDQLPTRPQRNWPAIVKQWATLSPQQQQDYIKEFQETNGGKNPMSFDLPNGAGKILYHPSDPKEQMFYPKTGDEETDIPGIGKQHFRYALDPNAHKVYEGGKGPPSIEEASSVAAAAAGAKKTAEGTAEAGTTETKEAQKALTGIRGLGVVGAQNVEPYAKAAVQIVNDPTFQQTGLLSSGNQLLLERVKKQLNMPSSATPLTVLGMINKTVLNGMQSGAKSFSSEGGETPRLFQSEIETMKGELPPENATAEEQRVGWNAVLRRAQKWGDDALYFNDWAKKQPNGLPTSEIHSEIVRRGRDFKPFGEDNFSTATTEGAETPAAPAAPPAPPAAAPAAPSGTPSPASVVRQPFSPSLSDAATGRGAVGAPAGAGPGAAAAMGTANPIAQALMTGDNPLANPDVAQTFNKANAAGAAIGTLPISGRAMGATGRFIFGGHDANAPQWLARLAAGGGGEEALKALIKHLMGGQ